jgi:hypothetical protein
MSLRRETMSTLPAELPRGLGPRSAAYETAVSPSTLREHVLDVAAPGPLVEIDQSPSETTGVATPIQFEHQAGIEPASPAWKAGSSATRTLVHSSERPPGVEPGLSGWRPDVQPRTPWAQRSRDRDSHPDEPVLQTSAYLFGHLDEEEAAGIEPAWRPRASLRLATGHHYRSVTLPAEERGGIEPLALVATTPVFETGYRPFSGSLRGRAVEESNPAARFWRPSWSQTTTHNGCMWSLRALPPAPPHCQRGVLLTELRPHLRGGNRTPIDLVPSQVVSH